MVFPEGGELGSSPSLEPPLHSQQVESKSQDPVSGKVTPDMRRLKDRWLLTATPRNSDL